MENFDLIKDIWTIEDIPCFLEYLRSFSKGKDKAEWEKRIINTQYPCLAVPSTKIDEIVKKIYKGNYLSFIDLFITDNYSCLIITGKLIAKIPNFELMRNKLIKYIELVDNWGGCDCLKFNVKKNEEQKYFNLASEFILSKKPFTRRLGLIILFKLISEQYIDEILQICLNLKREQHYYVNMAGAWLVAECFIKQREKTLKIIKSKRLNKFIQNKAISKCHDSFRVDLGDKEMLKNYRV